MPSVSQPPSPNFSTEVTTRIVRQKPRPTQNSAMSPARAGLAAPANRRAQHAGHRQRERDEHVDAVHHEQAVDPTLRVEQRQQRRETHPDDAVLCGEAVRERCEPLGEPAVERHVRQHARSVDEAGLRGDDEQQRLGGQRRGDECAGARPVGGDALRRAPRSASCPARPRRRRGCSRGAVRSRSTRASTPCTPSCVERSAASARA
jgi:hypothetical protein